MTSQKLRAFANRHGLPGLLLVGLYLAVRRSWTRRRGRLLLAVVAAAVIAWLLMPVRCVLRERPRQPLAPASLLAVQQPAPSRYRHSRGEYPESADTPDPDHILSKPWKTLNTGYVDGLEFSPDGRYLAVSVAPYYHDSDECIALYDTASWRVAHTLPHEQAQGERIFSPDGSRVVTFRWEDGPVKVWSTSAWKPELRLYTAKCPDFTASGELLVARRSPKSTDGYYDVEELRDPRMLAVVQRFAQDNPRPDPAWPGQNERAFEIPPNTPGASSVEIRDATSGALSRRLERWGSLRAVSRDCCIVVTQGANLSRLRVWDYPTGRIRFELHEYGPVKDARLSPDDRWLASVGDEWDSRLWDMRSGRKSYSLRGGQEPVYAAAFSPDGKLLAVGGKDGRVWLWRVPQRG